METTQNRSRRGRSGRPDRTKNRIIRIESILIYCNQFNSHLIYHHQVVMDSFVALVLQDIKEQKVKGKQKKWRKIRLLGMGTLAGGERTKRQETPFVSARTAKGNLKQSLSSTSMHSAESSSLSRFRYMLDTSKTETAINCNFICMMTWYVVLFNYSF